MPLFILPNLESFIRDEVDLQRDYAVIHSLSNFFIASFPPLRTFSLRGIMPNDDILLLLRSIPTVTDLVISHTMHAR